MLLRILCTLPFVFASAVSVAADVVIQFNQEDALSRFAAGEINSALAKRGIAVSTPSQQAVAANSWIVRFNIKAGLGAPEGFRIERATSDGTTRISIDARDTGGLLYGGLEVAEQVRIGGLESVVAMTRAPRFAMRGVKFNLPLDVRTPSYSDMSDAAQANIGEVWNFEFWTEFLDRLARDRYNYVSLWNLNPFPSLVKVPGYEDVSLEDVQRSTIKFKEDYSTRTTDISTPAMLAKVETVRTMTIEQKIDFWRRVMQYGRDRNIDFYIITWNTYTYGTGGKHGITDALENPVTIDYFRKSVAELFRTYPLLRGIGVTAGENMRENNSSFEAKENWLLATYGQGVLDAAREQPGRKIRFIHRQHETSASDIARTFAPLTANPDIDFVFSFKYAQAHVMSSTKQTFHHKFVDSLGAMKTLWTLRNDDALMFRWGAPNFVREFISGMPRDVSQGVYYGSDMWVWGREFLSLDPETPRQLEIAKHWFQWMLWGRLAYDPTLDNDRIVALLALRYPEVDARSLLEAWQHASMTYPLTTGFHWGKYDFQWYIEGCRSRPGQAQTASGFHDVNRFITLGPHPGTDNVPIPQYVEAVLQGKKLDGTTPEQVAAKLHEHAGAALAAVTPMQAGANKELRATLGDIRLMALLGDYYGYKITGATELHFFRTSGQAEHKQKAVVALTNAAESWQQYTKLAGSLYKNPLWTNRVGIVDWAELNAEVARDIVIARESTLTSR